MLKGTIVGVRPFSGVSKKNNQPFAGAELCIRRAPDFVNRDFIGQQFDVFMAFENALGGYTPAPGDGVSYHLYRQGSSMQCGFVLPAPEYDEGSDK